MDAEVANIIDGLGENQSEDGLALVAGMVENMKLLMQTISEAEDNLKSMKAKLRELEEVSLVDLLDSYGLQTVTLATGEEVVIDEFIKAALPTKTQINKQKDEEKRDEMIARQKEGYDWLRDNNAGSIIKNQLKVDFIKGQDNMVVDLIGICEEHTLPYDRQTNVDSRTLSKVIQEKLENGADVPLDVFGVYSGRKAKLKKPKK